MIGSARMCTWSIWDRKRSTPELKIHNTRGRPLGLPLFSVRKYWAVVRSMYRLARKAIRLPVNLDDLRPRNEMRAWLSSIPRCPRHFHEASVCTPFRNSSCQDFSFGTNCDDANCPLGLGRACLCARADCDD